MSSTHCLNCMFCNTCTLAFKFWQTLYCCIARARTCAYAADSVAIVRDSSWILFRHLSSYVAHKAMVEAWVGSAQLHGSNSKVRTVCTELPIQMRWFERPRVRCIHMQAIQILSVFENHNAACAGAQAPASQWASYVHRIQYARESACIWRV